MAHKPEIYKISLWNGPVLTPADLAALTAILKEGGAVDPTTASKQLPHALWLVSVNYGLSVVAMGVIKRPRPMYTAKIQERSGVKFDPATPELGYVAVKSDHKGRGLSHCILHALLNAHRQPVFATTDSLAMAKTLAYAGLVHRGNPWEGKRGQLSLWVSPMLDIT